MTHRLAYILILALTAASAAWGQQQFRQPPRVGFVYPAGGQQGTTVDATLGGQYFNAVSEVFVSGLGVKVELLPYEPVPNVKQATEFRDEIKQIREKQIDADAMKRLREIRHKLALFERARLTPTLGERAQVKITIAPDAAPGDREIRLMTSLGLSNPLVFQVGRLPESRQPDVSGDEDWKRIAKALKEPDKLLAPEGEPKSPLSVTLPTTVNGQILPGEVGRVRFHAKKGQQIVAAVWARALIPYLADAVPGWCQAVISLSGPDGREVACVDDFRFNPDPALYYVVPRDGDYTLAIWDALYRGREDFVYRINLGEIPFVTDIFPLGGRRGERVAVTARGWNLPATGVSMDLAGAAGSRRPFTLASNACPSNTLPFAVDDLPEITEQEPNDDAARAMRVTLPVIINGRIDRPDDWDVYRFHAAGGSVLDAEVFARRLGSPLDSFLKLTDAEGRVLAVNDDCEDRGAALVTHQADSHLVATLPAAGDYLLWIGDTQRKGGPEYGYRLKVGFPRPDFELRVTPSAVNARGGTTVPITVYALRRDGFSGEISVRLANAPAGYALSGWLPPGESSARLTLTVPAMPKQKLTQIALEGSAKIEGKEVARRAVPAEDMEQAFAYHHLVPAESWLAAIESTPWGGPGWQVDAPRPLKLRAGEKARLTVEAGRKFATRGIELQLSDPPDGVTIESQTPSLNGIAITLRVDGSKLKQSTKGNLIFTVLREIKAPAKDDDPPKSVKLPQGVLPAVPFELTR